MAANSIEPKGFSLRRWSQRKHAAARDRTRGADGAPSAVGPLESTPSSAVAAAVPSTVSTEPSEADAKTASNVVVERAGSATPALPSLDSLTIDSDYSPFMQPGVDDALKRGALRKLFRDPRFNVMDGLDVYIDDYSKPDPIDPAIVRTLNQARYIFNPPATRVNAAGHVEDVPDDGVADDAAARADKAESTVGGEAGDPPAALPPAPAMSVLSGGASAAPAVIAPTDANGITNIPAAIPDTKR